MYDLRAHAIGLEDGKDRYTFKLIQKYISSNDLVLDLGCGRGSILNPLVSKGVNAIGFDYSSSNVKLLQQAGRKVILGNATKPLPFNQNSFHVVICYEFLEHFKLDDIHNILDNIYRILKPNGYLFFTVPKKEKLKTGAVSCPQCKHIFHHWGHMTSFDDDLIKYLLAKHRFTIKKIMSIYGATLYKIGIPLFVIKLLSNFELKFKQVNKTLANYLVIAKRTAASNT
ncbi:Methyltransferase type 11 [Syntrophobacter fumaroxidans MPOB]|uniref:Methyltransferase type 11 n=2 Tax=Syntrophobacter TaxID=29526 RepID=A0LKC1_SYNFM|nr:Methyltransferase type 11 [Syntrophobacter fumaroxidans MPOB]